MLHRYGCQEKGNQTRTRSRPIAGQKAKTMRLSKLRKKTLKQAKRERRRGSLTQEQYRACIAVVEDHAALVELNERVERDVNPWNRADGLIGADKGQQVRKCRRRRFDRRGLVDLVVKPLGLVRRELACNLKGHHDDRPATLTGATK